jgi:hypothetical protein
MARRCMGSSQVINRIKALQGSANSVVALKVEKAKTRKVDEVHTEDALGLWTDMLLEELEHDDKRLRLISRAPVVPSKS